MPNENSPMMVGKRAFSIAETARILGLGRTTIYRHLDTGALEAIKIGRRRLVLLEQIEAVIAKHKKGK